MLPPGCGKREDVLSLPDVNQLSSGHYHGHVDWLGAPDKCRRLVQVHRQIITGINHTRDGMINWVVVMESFTLSVPALGQPWFLISNG